MHEDTIEYIWKSVAAVRERAPVIHNITNYVVMNTTANALLALGASPVMAHAREEAADMVGIASALVVNIGTLSREWVLSMFSAAEHAKKKGIPVILDPVGAGATPYRTDTAREFVREFRPTVIRGNASEVMAVREDRAKTKGVDSTEASHDALASAHEIHRDFGSVVVISGETDFIIGRGRTVMIRNGHPMMTRVTGMGCAATALCGAFSAVSDDPFSSAAAAMAVMGIAGEMAAEKSDGPGTLQVRFLDALFSLSREDIVHRIRVEG